MIIISFYFSIFICLLQTSLFTPPIIVVECRLNDAIKTTTIAELNNNRNLKSNTKPSTSKSTNGSNNNEKPSGCDTDDPRFDYYLLVLQWPYTYSQKNYIRDFTIHGLWPSRSYDERTYPCNCKDTPFDLGQISAYHASKLKLYWPSLSSSNERFWEHEWTKHGTCSNAMSLSSYFHATLNLRDKYNPLLPLSEFISQGDNGLKFYNVNDIKNALYIAYGAGISIGCKKFTNKDYQYLSEVAFCLSKDIPLFPFKRSCPINLRKNVSSEIANCDPTKPIAIPYPSDSEIRKI